MTLPDATCARCGHVKQDHHQHVRQYCPDWMTTFKYLPGDRRRRHLVPGASPRRVRWDLMRCWKLSDRAIAEKLGCSRTAVILHRKKNGHKPASRSKHTPQTKS